MYLSVRNVVQFTTYMTVVVWSWTVRNVVGLPQCGLTGYMRMIKYMYVHVIIMPV